MRCEKTLFTRQILTAGTMKDYCTIISRDLQPSSPDSIENIEVMTDIMGMDGKLEDISFVTRFDGVNIANGATHLYYIPYQQSIYELDINNLFVRRKCKVGLPKDKDRYYKMLGIRNYGEQDQYNILQLKETGFTNKLANTI
jgi:hypothetical protein